jgi:hypothetical protein
MKLLPDLFGDPQVAIGKTDTSLEAARAVQPDATAIRARVLADIRRRGTVGATPSECAQRLKLHILSVRPRTTELKEQGLIVDSKKRRKNSRDNNEIVWVAVDAARVEQVA